jgi:replicative DNA helicase
MLNGKPLEIFDSITKYRAENKTDEILVIALPVERSTQVEVTDWLVDTVPSMYSQYYEALERDFISREKNRIFSETGDYRIDCMEAALQLIRLAESGTLVESDLETQVDLAKYEIAKRQSPDYKSIFETKSLKSFSDLGHYEPGSLVTLGGGSGHGKTTFALNLTNIWLKAGLSVVYFSNEMTDVVFLSKMLCIKYGIQWQKLMKSRGEGIDGLNLELVFRQLDEFKSQNLKIFTRPYNLQEMSLIVKTYKPNVFILDTINALISKRNDDRTDIALGDMAREMKDIAEENTSLGIVVAQLKDIVGRPTDKDMVKESRQIRDASDYMDFIYREYEHKPHSQHEILRDVFEVYRAKGRFTGQGEAYLKIDVFTGQITEHKVERLNQIVQFFKENKRRLFREEL